MQGTHLDHKRTSASLVVYHHCAIDMLTRVHSCMLSLPSKNNFGAIAYRALHRAATKYTAKPTPGGTHTTICTREVCDEEPREGAVSCTLHPRQRTAAATGVRRDELCKGQHGLWTNP